MEEQVSKLRRAHSETLNQLQRARARITFLTKENQRLEHVSSDLRTALASCAHRTPAPAQRRQEVHSEGASPHSAPLPAPPRPPGG